jgi:hypothetical protein
MVSIQIAKIYWNFKPGLVPKHLNLWILIPSAISTLLAVLSGENIEEKLEDICMEVRETLENHELFANITIWSVLILTFIWIWITLKGMRTRKFNGSLWLF